MLGRHHPYHDSSQHAASYNNQHSEEALEAQEKEEGLLSPPRPPTRSKTTSWTGAVKSCRVTSRQQ